MFFLFVMRSIIIEINKKKMGVMAKKQEKLKETPDFLEYR